MEIELANEIIKTVRSDDCHRLRYQKLGALLELVIHNEKVVDILKTIRILPYDNNICFNIVYINYISNNKQFQLLSDINSLALSWLYTLYH
jgi:hypothetical protein